MPVPDFITHYYDAAAGPLRSLTDLPSDLGEHILEGIRSQEVLFASKRNTDYLQIRRDLEARVRRLFVQKGGRPLRRQPHYFVLGACPWLHSWYSQGREIHVPLREIDPAVISFTYGDTFPAMRLRDGKPHRGQVYTLAQLANLVQTFGLPQVGNSDGQFGPDRYIEAQLWDDEPVRQFLPLAKSRTRSPIHI